MSASKSADHPRPDELAAMFRDAVLVLGGVFVVRGTDDETVRRIATGLERVYRRARGEHLHAHRARSILSPHPAIEALLRLVRDDDRAAAEKAPVATAPDPDEYIKLPGLFLGWEVAQVLDADHDFHVEGAGSTADGSQLFAVYRQDA